MANLQSQFVKFELHLVEAGMVHVHSKGTIGLDWKHNHSTLHMLFHFAACLGERQFHQLNSYESPDEPVSLLPSSYSVENRGNSWDLLVFSR